MEEDTDIVKRGTIAEKVKAYNVAMQKIELAYDILKDAEVMLKSAFSVGEKHDTDFGTLPGHYHDSTDNVDDKIKQVKKIIKRKAWRCLYNDLEIDRITSIKRSKEIIEKLEEGELPEITIENIFDTFEALNQNVNEFARESVLEVYRWLRPNVDSYEMKTYKTNQQNASFELKKKVIKSGMVEYSCGRLRVNSWNEKYLIALDKVFHMLEGANMLDKSHRSPLVDAINSSETLAVKTDYFFCRMYQNGNLHIEFIRADLVQKFNAIAGGMNLKPAN